MSLQLDYLSSIRRKNKARYFEIKNTVIRKLFKRYGDFSQTSSKEIVFACIVLFIRCWERCSYYDENLRKLEQNSVMLGTMMKCRLT